jgi:hypothetical protein
LVARDAELQKIGDIKVYAYGVYNVQVSLNDTVPLSDFSDSENLTRAVLNKKTDGSAVACDISNNIVEVTDSVTNVDCVLYVFGVRA